MDFERPFRPAEARQSGFGRLPTILGEAMVATSHPLATRAGVRALDRGGNAVDAALAAAAMLCVAEPGHTGIGGDLFAQVWHDGKLHGLNGSGRSPAVLPELAVDELGPRSVTVPGSVRAWFDLSERLGSLGIMGGAMQAQAHLQVVHRLAERWDPQAALDAPRFRVESGRAVVVEPGLAGEIDRLRALGHEVSVGADPGGFGVGQAILTLEESLVGGSDGRGDGHAAGC